MSPHTKLARERERITSALAWPLMFSACGWKPAGGGLSITRENSKNSQRVSDWREMLHGQKWCEHGNRLAFWILPGLKDG